MIPSPMKMNARMKERAKEAQQSSGMNCAMRPHVEYSVMVGIRIIAPTAISVTATPAPLGSSISIPHRQQEILESGRQGAEGGSEDEGDRRVEVSCPGQCSREGHNDKQRDHQ